MNKIVIRITLPPGLNEMDENKNKMILVKNSGARKSILIHF